MATLVSPGVSVTIINESFFIPAQATTVPLFFIATADEKTQPDGVTAAAGTYEYNTIRTVTSLTQSTQLYGVPTFLTDSNGNPQHGDCRNEYGTFALNQYLGIGTTAYVVRANVNLNDNLAAIQSMWNSATQQAAYVLENLATSYINQYNTSNGFSPSEQSDVSLFGTIVGGTGYTNGTFNNVPLTGGTGDGATANITVSSGSVAAAVLVNGGYGYTTGDTLSALPNSIGQGIATFGSMVGGSAYTNNTYTNVPLTGGTTTPGTATVAFIAASTITPTTALGILPGSYNVNVNVDGTGPTIYTIAANGADTMTSMAASLATITGISVAAVGNAFVFTSNTSGAASSVAVTFPAGGSYPDLIGAINVSLGSTPTNISVQGTTTGGTGAQATIIVSGGTVTTVTLTAPGVGYTIGQVLSANASSIGGTGSGFSIQVATVVASSGFTVQVAAVTANLYKTTLTSSELLSLTTTATLPVFSMFSFRNSSADFFANHTSLPIPVYSNGFSNPPVGPGFLGFAGMEAAWVTNLSGSVPPHTGWTPVEAGNFLLNAASLFEYTTDFVNQTSLGANDAARRSAIITALAAVINSNTDVRSETYEYNLILCPGFPEVVQELVNLCIDIQEEAMVIGDTPFTSTPDTVVAWASTVARQSSTDVAYYYPHGLATNLDGATVFVAASGTALATIAYSDSVSQVWFAPAGLRRGIVSSLTDVGYVTGTLGTATTFVEAALNQGQRNNLYQYFTNINPIVFFPGQGIIVWGQKTSANAASALDRINVVRLLMYIKRALRKNSMVFVFEPNDALTQGNLKAAVDAFLNNLITLRGLYDFATVCDSSNNTPTVVDANELYIDIALKPVRAAEFIYIPIRVVATSASLTTNG